MSSSLGQRCRVFPLRCDEFPCRPQGHCLSPGVVVIQDCIWMTCCWAELTLRQYYPHVLPEPCSHGCGCLLFWTMKEVLHTQCGEWGSAEYVDIMVSPKQKEIWALQELMGEFECFLCEALAEVCPQSTVKNNFPVFLPVCMSEVPVSWRKNWIPLMGCQVLLRFVPLPKPLTISNGQLKSQENWLPNNLICFH